METLWIWERARHEAPPRRALTILAAGVLGETLGALGHLSIGNRDARLLQLRELTFGSRLSALGTCPACARELETEFETADVKTASRAAEPVTQFCYEGINAQLRLLDSIDLEASSQVSDLSIARRELIGRAILDCRGNDGRAIAAENLSAEFIAAAASRLSEADPQADVQVALSCPDCAHTWSAVFDIAEFFWTELQACARRLLREVHELAEAYGWSETEILALTPARRAAYLELVRG